MTLAFEVQYIINNHAITLTYTLVTHLLLQYFFPFLTHCESLRYLLNKTTSLCDWWMKIKTHLSNKFRHAAWSLVTDHPIGRGTHFWISRKNGNSSRRQHFFGISVCLCSYGILIQSQSDNKKIIISYLWKTVFTG